jgi:arylsulfatase
LPELKHLAAADITIRVDGKEVAKGTVPTLVNLAFTANDCFDIGADMSSPVSQAYFDQAPFKFTGTINSVDVRYVK